MKNTLPIIATLFALVCGCTTINSTTAFNGVNVDGARTPVETVEIENSGWFLFTCIPIASGNPARPNAVSCKWFKNTVKLKNNIDVLHAHMKERDVDEISNLTSHCEDEKYLVFLLARRSYHTSAVLLAPTTASAGKPASSSKPVPASKPASASKPKPASVNKPKPANKPASVSKPKPANKPKPASKPKTSGKPASSGKNVKSNKK